jgi:hypothetical protein
VVRWFCGLIGSREATGGGEGGVGFPLVTAGLPAGAVVGAVAAGSCASDFACGSLPPTAGACPTGGLPAGVVAALTGAVVLAGAVAVFG